MPELSVVVVSWNRPHFLCETLRSLRCQLTGTNAQVYVIDNGSEQETRSVIQACDWLAGILLHQHNLGINGALESAFASTNALSSEYILISDADMSYRLPLTLGMDLLSQNDDIGAVSYQNSPEHGTVCREGLTEVEPTWIIKTVERGCSLLLRTSDLQKMRPLPVHLWGDFDWWIVRDCPQSLSNRGKVIAVLPGGAVHLGYRQGDSTWQTQETPEFDEYKQVVRQLGL